MQRQILKFMIRVQLFALALVASLNISKNLQVAEPSTSLKNRAENHIFLIEIEIDNESIRTVSIHLQIVD